MILGALFVVAQAIAAPDPLAVKGIAQVWLGAQSSWASGAVRKDVAVAQVNLAGGFGRWGAGVRARSTGAVGQFRPDQPATFAAAEGYAAVWRNVAALAGSITAGPVAFAGLTIPLETQNGQSPVMPRSCTAMAGLRLTGPTWRAEVGAGMHQQLKGAALGISVHVEMTEHSAWVVDLATGAGGHYLGGVALLLRP